jgi:TrwC relaxase
MALAFGNPRPFASESSALPHTVYNTALEYHLRDTLGVRFAGRADGDPRLRPIREIVGVDPALNRRWSARRASIETRRGELARQFQRDHGRPPTLVEMLHLAQQATLETRSAKHEPRTLTEQNVAKPLLASGFVVIDLDEETVPERDDDPFPAGPERPRTRRSFWNLLVEGPPRSGRRPGGGGELPGGRVTALRGGVQPLRGSLEVRRVGARLCPPDRAARGRG